MMRCNSIYRERLKSTLEHQPVDRCPIDLGGTPQSTIDDALAVRELAAYLGYFGEPPGDYDKFDRRILEHFDIDFRRAGGLVLFDTNYSRKISDTEMVDCFGIRSRFSGTYWDIVSSPLQDAELDDLASYTLPKVSQIPPEVLDDWAAQARILCEQSPYVVVGEHPIYGVLELACWLCGYDHIMLMLALNPEFIHLLFGKILEFQKSIIREYYSRLGPYIHITTSGDDFGTQKAMFMSPEMWREFIKPYLKERIAYTRKFTDAVYMHHSCGAIFEIIPDLIEIGVKILNPIQPTAAGMDPRRLKAVYGKAVTFHGGLDTQEVLPSNSFRKIDEAVGILLEIMDPCDGGGYIFAPAHNIQGDVSPASVARVYSAAQRMLRNHLEK